MTCKEIGEYCEEQKNRDKALYLENSSIQYRIGQYLTNALYQFGSKHPQLIEYKELFPELHEEDTASKEEAIANKWREFLGVV